MVAAEAAAAGCPPLVAAPLAASPRSPRGSRTAYPARLRAPRRRSRPATSRELRAKLDALLALPAGRPRGAAAPPPGGRRRALVVGRRRRAVARRPSRSLQRPWARNSASLPRSSSPRAREAFEEGTDFTVAVEEEFALLDPETLELVEPLRGAEGRGAGHRARAAPRRRADRLRGRGAHRHAATTFAEAAATMVERRAQLRALAARARARRSAPPARTRGARWQDQRIIDTPHYRRNDELLRYVVWRNNTFGLHVHVGISGGDRAIARLQRAAQLPARAARALGELAVRRGASTRGLHSARTQIFTRMFPRCGIPDAVRRLGGVRGLRRASSTETGSIDEHTQLWWSVRPAPRLPDGRDPDLRRAARPGRGADRSPRSPTRSPPACARALDEGEPLPDLPHRLLEENLWRAIRYGLSGELIDFDRGESVPARARHRAADRVGAAGRRGDRRRAVPRGPGGERGRAAERALAGGRDARADLRDEQVLGR